MEERISKATKTIQNMAVAMLVATEPVFKQNEKVREERVRLVIRFLKISKKLDEQKKALFC